MSAWFVFDGGASMAALKARAASIDTISAEWVQCGDDGRAVRREHPTADEREALKAVCKANHIRLLALAANNAGGDFAAGGVEKAMQSETAMRTHADELVKIAVDDGIDGVDLDYESLNAKDREPFSKFARILADDCHANKLSLAIAVHPKESEPGTWDGAQAQDWAALGQAVDFFRVMTYDQHWDSSEAGPISSPDWAERVARFAVSEVAASKVDIGVPGYGYDWVAKHGRDVTWSDFQTLVKLHGPCVRDSISQELTLRYKDLERANAAAGVLVNHTVYFPDATSAATKFDLAKKLGVHGVALWRLGIEDPAMWDKFGR